MGLISRTYDWHVAWIALRAMGHPLRWLLPGVIYETTIRTIQGRFLLRPDAPCREIILGVLGRAQALYPNVRLYAFVYLSNHAHLLVSCDHGQELVSFLGFVNGNVAREMGRLYDWPGPFWGRRHRPIPILDDEALIDRLQYVVAQGVKKGLVSSPMDWPGASAVPALVDDMVLHGTWYDRNRETRTRRRFGQPPSPEQFATRYPVQLTPIPAWAILEDAERRARYRALVDAVEYLHRSPDVLGAAALQQKDPHERPRQEVDRPAPHCHTGSPKLRSVFKTLLATFISTYRAAAAAVRIVTTSVVAFPPGSFPSRLRAVAWIPASNHPPWAISI